MPTELFPKIAFIGNYLPRKCGIATFTFDMCNSIVGRMPGLERVVVPVNDRPEGYEYPPEVRFELHKENAASYYQAARFLNDSEIDIVSLQHEFGIFGGVSGSLILNTLRDLRKDVVTTLHTVLKKPTEDQRWVIREICRLSARVVVMTEMARVFLREVYGIPSSKIEVIAHGIPDVPFEDPNRLKNQVDLSGRLVALTFGLLSPNKGIEQMLKAMNKIIQKFPGFTYIVLGATHPELVRNEGERYRSSLQEMACTMGISDHVKFLDRFVDLEELTLYIRASDLYVTPYLNPAQITSGTLAYAFGCGNPIVSTPYWHAEELLANGRGVLVPFADSEALAREINGLLADAPRRESMAREAYRLGREMIWENSADHYIEIFQNVWKCRNGRALKNLAEKPIELPSWRFDHLFRLTDKTGILQHANHSIPNFEEGYCTDDNARALLLTIHLEELGLLNTDLAEHAVSYASFLHAAYNPETGRYRNFQGYDRRWLEPVGSEDSQGRAAWALGVCVGSSDRLKLRSWAMSRFQPSILSVLETTSPRAWAFGLLGLTAYSRRNSQDQKAIAIRDQFINRLVDLFERNATSDWYWFEDILSYDLGRVPQAMIAAGKASGHQQALKIGLEALEWLINVQKSPLNHFRPVGCMGFYRKGEEKAIFDQQPIEANAMVSACVEAFRATRHPVWLNEAQIAFLWFLGRNDLGQELYDPISGGCFDGLQENRINQNQGAESTLAFLLSLAEMTHVSRLNTTKKLNHKRVEAVSDR